MAISVEFHHTTGHEEHDPEGPAIFAFQSEAEARAFELGVNETHDAMEGWTNSGAWCKRPNPTKLKAAPPGPPETPRESPEDKAEPDSEQWDRKPGDVITLDTFRKK